MQEKGTLSVACSVCTTRKEIEVDIEKFYAWQGGELIQNALPELTPGERELLISGICEKCFDEILGGE